MRYVGPRQIVIDGEPVATPFWQPDRSFAGQPVVIVGGGPSLTDLDLGLVAGHRFIVVNSGCRKLRPIATRDDLLYFTDNAWSENRPELVKDWPGPVVTANRHAKVRLGDAVRYIDVLALTEHMGVLCDFSQASSGHIAACLAAVMGADPILLVAFEGCAVDGRTHGHGDYSQHDLAAFTERFQPGWRGLVPAFGRMGVTVINATPVTAIDCFERMSLQDALCPIG